MVGPGSSLGGLEWGSATDGKRIYFAVANFNFSPAGHYAMVNPPMGTPATSDAGRFGAIDPATGQIQLADGRSERLDRPRPSERRERCRLRRLDGRDIRPAIREHGADDVRARCGKR